MKLEKPNIGLLIEQRMNELGVNKSELARRCGIANQNINRLLSRESIDTDKLATISEALDFNFFSCYRPHATPASSCGAVTIAADGGVAVSTGGSAHHITTNAAVLAERVKSLEALLAEKERLIKVYEKMVEK